MYKLFISNISFLLFCFFPSPPANAADDPSSFSTIKVYSKRQTNIAIFDGNCRTSQGLEAIERVQRNLGLSGKMRKKQREAIAEVLKEQNKDTQGACTARTAQIHMSKGTPSTVQAKPGQLVVAHKATGNKSAAICLVKEGYDIELRTSKSEGLRKLFGKAGDFGLTCKYTDRSNLTKFCSLKEAVFRPGDRLTLRELQPSATAFGLPTIRKMTGAVHQFIEIETRDKNNTPCYFSFGLKSGDQDSSKTQIQSPDFAEIICSKKTKRSKKKSCVGQMGSPTDRAHGNVIEEGKLTPEHITFIKSHFEPRAKHNKKFDTWVWKTGNKFSFLTDLYCLINRETKTYHCKRFAGDFFADPSSLIEKIKAERN